MVGINVGNAVDGIAVGVFVGTTDGVYVGIALDGVAVDGANVGNAVDGVAVVGFGDG